mmetsp:Transcript_12672/g.30118  ORF Transcript_12672/g.30118 Transcript_12672/m.30118 type:complete len:216 (+) Transcript_12672:519-1166(+)
MRVSPRSMKGAPGSPPPPRAARLGRGIPWHRNWTGSFLRWMLNSFRTDRYVSRTSSNRAASISPGGSPPAPRWACMPLRRWQSSTAALAIMWYVGPAWYRRRGCSTTVLQTLRRPWICESVNPPASSSSPPSRNASMAETTRWWPWFLLTVPCPPPPGTMAAASCCWSRVKADRTMLRLHSSSSLARTADPVADNAPQPPPPSLSLSHGTPPPPF